MIGLKLRLDGLDRQITRAEKLADFASVAKLEVEERKLMAEMALLSGPSPETVSAETVCPQNSTAGAMGVSETFSLDISTSTSRYHPVAKKVRTGDPVASVVRAVVPTITVTVDGGSTSVVSSIVVSSKKKPMEVDTSDDDDDDDSSVPPSWLDFVGNKTEQNNV